MSCVPLPLAVRDTDGTFELNLAPFLDIIVSVVPMLLLSIAFIQIKSNTHHHHSKAHYKAIETHDEWIIKYDCEN